MRILPFISLFSVATTCLLAEQQIVFKGTPPLIVKAEDFRVDGKNVKYKTKLGAATSEVAKPIKDVERMDWTEPTELGEAQKMLAEGKPKEAIVKLDEQLEFFEPFKSTPGNWYNQISLTKLEALDRAGDVQNTQLLLRDLEMAELDDTSKFKIKLIKLNMDRRTSSNTDEISKRAEAMMKDTNDSSVQASLWLLIGEIRFKNEQWEDALMAFLHVPVFYGSQKQLLPTAELQIARCFVKMQRFPDANMAYQRIMDTYKGSEAFETAKAEKVAVEKTNLTPPEK